MKQPRRRLVCLNPQSHQYAVMYDSRACSNTNDSAPAGRRGSVQSRHIERHPKHRHCSTEELPVEDGWRKDKKLLGSVSQEEIAAAIHRIEQPMSCQQASRQGQQRQQLDLYSTDKVVGTMPPIHITGPLRRQHRDEKDAEQRHQPAAGTRTGAGDRHNNGSNRASDATLNHVCGYGTLFAGPG